MLRRAVACGLNPRKIVDALTIFSGATRIEAVHPLQFGYVRRKLRTQRRSGMRVVNPLLFHPWRAVDFTLTAARWLRLATRYRAILRRVLADPNAQVYTDRALQPVTDDAQDADELVKAFADKIPRTHGAPQRQVEPVR